jgi:CRP/FNR family cyclic AMP-dependent transcriptional regulator
MQKGEVSAEVLREIALFAELPDAERSVLAACLVARRYAAGEVVFREDEPGGTLFVVIEGLLVATTALPDGSAKVLNQMERGEVAGEMAFLDPAPRSATVSAVEPTLVYELNHDTMTVLRQRAPAAVAAVVAEAIRDVARRLRRLDERIADAMVES